MLNTLGENNLLNFNIVYMYKVIFPHFLFSYTSSMDKFKIGSICLKFYWLFLIKIHKNVWMNLWLGKILIGVNLKFERKKGV